MVHPEIRYAQSDNARIAYQVIGDGPLDLVMVAGLVSHLGLIWEDPEHAAFCTKLARLARLILFDKRGTGLSDRNAGIPNLDERMSDLRAVLAAAGAQRPVLLGISEGGMMSMLFAATYPERVRALVLYGAFAQSPTRIWPADQVEARLELVERSWGVAMMPPTVAPTKAGDSAFRRNWARFEQQSASPAAARELLRLSREADVSPVLPSLAVPVLVAHRSGDRRVGIEHAHYLAEHIPQAKFVELPGDDHLPYIGDSDRLAAEIEAFLIELATAG